MSLGDDEPLTLRPQEARITRWMHAHPRIIDWIVVLLCTGLQRIALTFTGEPVNWGAYVALGIAGAALLWRRRFPFTVLIAVTAVAAVSLLISPDLAYQGLPSPFALYAVAARQSTARAALGYLVAVALPALATLIQGLRESAPFSPSILDPLALLALALGIAVRARRQRHESLTALLEQRAERARITAEMHRILRVLRANDSDLDEALHESGHNVPSLEELVEVFRAAGLPVTLSRHGATAMDDPALQTTIHRIVQESLTNALRYAEGATEVRVEVTATPSAIEVTVTDDGHPDSGRPTVGAGVGLTGIRERAAAFGGTSTAGPLEGGDWRTHTQLPSRSRA